MNNKIKIITGTSVVGVLWLTFHIFHLVHTIKEVFKNDKGENMFKNARVTIITTDSTGKKDTTLMDDYLKKQK